MNRKIAKSLRGFTLIQTLIVIALIGVLAIAIVVIFDPIDQIKKANDNKRKSDLALIQKALQEYYNDFGKFPLNPGNCLEDFSQCKIVRLDGKTVEWGESFAPFMKLLPKDPSKNKTYIYYVKENRQSYYMYANLDRGQDGQACNSGGPCLSLSYNGFKNDKPCGEICNYGVSSSNVTP